MILQEQPNGDENHGLKNLFKDCRVKNEENKQKTSSNPR